MVPCSIFSTSYIHVIVIWFFLGSGTYIYIETSSPRSNGDEAVLRSPTIKAGSPIFCLKFAYHMYGTGVGELKLETVTEDGSRTENFTKNAVSENAWKVQEVTLNTQNSDYHVCNDIFSRIICKSFPK